eukprot:Gregarina_sp_Poly_1__10749@NODE_81_length_15589_cov_30_056114_g69_i0_p1_GENE_NODE_81_length_15589_cov_30_056114_g69_i0NODE_81_length_15589_cov_30_056114_g69_i0_p1_ORF_typecomplete_len3738_score657_24Borrelia_P83/PF05262_11/0_35Borrelia_P83/PF05262_11/38_NODE_81_length_15589_cov_30_056114_g69_i08011293
MEVNEPVIRSPFNDPGNWYMPVLRVASETETGSAAKILEQGRLFALRSGWGGRPRLQRLAEELAKSHFKFVPVSPRGGGDGQPYHLGTIPAVGDIAPPASDEYLGDRDTFYTLERLGQKSTDSRLIAWSRLCPLAPTSSTDKEERISASVAEIISKDKRQFYKDHLVCQDIDWVSQMLLPIDVTLLQARKVLQSDSASFGRLRYHVSVETVNLKTEDSASVHNTPPKGREKKKLSRQFKAQAAFDTAVSLTVTFEQPSCTTESSSSVPHMWVVPQVHWEATLLHVKNPCTGSISQWGISSVSRLCNKIVIKDLVKFQQLMPEHLKTSRAYCCGKPGTCYFRIRLTSRFVEPLVTCFIPGDHRKRRLARSLEETETETTIPVEAPTIETVLDRLLLWSPLTPLYSSPLVSPSVWTKSEKIAEALSAGRKHDIKRHRRLLNSGTLNAERPTFRCAGMCNAPDSCHPRFHHELTASPSQSLRAQMASLMPWGELGCFGSGCTSWEVLEPLLQSVLVSPLLQSLLVETFVNFNLSSILNLIRDYNMRDEERDSPEKGKAEKSESQLAFSRRVSLGVSGNPSASGTETAEEESLWENSFGLPLPEFILVNDQQLPALRVLLIATARQAIVARVKQATRRIAHKWIFRTVKLLAELRGLRAALDLLDPQTILQYLRCSLFESCVICAPNSTEESRIRANFFVHQVSLISEVPDSKESAEQPQAFQTVQSSPQLDFFLDGSAISLEDILERHSKDRIYNDYLMPDGYKRRVVKSERCVCPTELTVQLLTERLAFGGPLSSSSSADPGARFTLPEYLDVSKLTALSSESSMYVLMSLLVALPRAKGEVTSGQFALFRRDVSTGAWSVCTSEQPGIFPLPQTRMFVDQMELHSYLDGDRDAVEKISALLKNPTFSKEADFRNATVSVPVLCMDQTCRVNQTSVMELSRSVQVLNDEATPLVADSSLIDEVVSYHHVPSYWTFSDWFVPMAATYYKTASILSLSALNEALIDRTRELTISPFFFHLAPKKPAVAESLFRIDKLATAFEHSSVFQTFMTLCHATNMIQERSHHAVTQRPGSTRSTLFKSTGPLEYYAFGNFSFVEGIDIQNPHSAANDVFQATNRYDWSVETPCLDEIVVRWEARHFPPVFHDPLRRCSDDLSHVSVCSDDEASDTGGSEDDFVDCCSCESFEDASTGPTFSCPMRRRTDLVSGVLRSGWRAWFAEDELPVTLAELQEDEQCPSDDASDHEVPAIASLATKAPFVRAEETTERPLVLPPSLCQRNSVITPPPQTPGDSLKVWREWALDASLMGDPFLSASVGSNLFRSHDRLSVCGKSCGLCFSLQRVEIAVIDEWQLFDGCNTQAFQSVLSGNNRQASSLLQCRVSRARVAVAGHQDGVHALRQEAALSENFDVAVPFSSTPVRWSSEEFGDGSLCAERVAEAWSHLPVSLRMVLSDDTSIVDVSRALVPLQRSSVVHEADDPLHILALTARWDETKQSHRVSWHSLSGNSDLRAALDECNGFLGAPKHPSHFAQRLYLLAVRPAGSLIPNPFIELAACSREMAIGMHDSSESLMQFSRALDESGSEILKCRNNIVLPEEGSLILCVKAFYPRHQGCLYLGILVVKESTELHEFCSLFDSVIDRRLAENLRVRRDTLLTLRWSLRRSPKEVRRIDCLVRLLEREILELDPPQEEHRRDGSVMIFEELPTNVLRPLEQRTKSLGALLSHRFATLVVQRLPAGYSLCPVCQKPVAGQLAAIRHYGCCGSGCEVVARLALDVKAATPMSLNGQTLELAAVPTVLFVQASDPTDPRLQQVKIVGEYNISGEEAADRPVWEMSGVSSGGSRRLFYDDCSSSWKIEGQMSPTGSWGTLAVSDSAFFSVSPLDLLPGTSWAIATADGFSACSCLNVAAERTLPEAPVTVALTRYIPPHSPLVYHPGGKFGALFRRLQFVSHGKPVYIKTPGSAFQRSLLIFDGNCWKFVMSLSGTTASLGDEDIVELARSVATASSSLSPDLAKWSALEFSAVNVALLWRPPILTLQSALPDLPPGEYVLSAHPAGGDFYISVSKSGRRREKYHLPTRINYFDLHGRGLQFYTTTAEAEAHEGVLELQRGTRTEGLWKLTPTQTTAVGKSNRNGGLVKCVALDELPLSLHLLAKDNFQVLEGTYFLMDSLYSFRPVYVKLFDRFGETPQLDDLHPCPLSPADLDAATAGDGVSCPPVFLYFSSVSETWRIASEIGSGFAVVETPETETGDFSFPPYVVRRLSNMDFPASVAEVRLGGQGDGGSTSLLLDKRGLDFESCASGRVAPIFLFCFHDCPKIKSSVHSLAAQSALKYLAQVSPTPLPKAWIYETETPDVEPPAARPGVSAASRRRRVKRRLWERTRRACIFSFRVPLPLALRERARRARTAAAAFTEYLHTRDTFLAGDVGRRLFESAAKSHHLLGERDGDAEFDSLKRALFFFGVTKDSLLRSERDAATISRFTDISPPAATGLASGKADTSNRDPATVPMRNSEPSPGTMLSLSPEPASREEPPISVEQILALVSGDTSDRGGQKKKKEKRKKKKLRMATSAVASSEGKSQVLAPKAEKERSESQIAGPVPKQTASEIGVAEKAKKATAKETMAKQSSQAPNSKQKQANPKSPKETATNAKESLNETNSLATDPKDAGSEEQTNAQEALITKNDEKNTKNPSNALDKSVETPACDLEALALSDSELQLGEALLQIILTSHDKINLGQLSILIQRDAEFSSLMASLRSRLRTSLRIPKVSLNQIIQQRFPLFLSTANLPYLEAAPWSSLVQVVNARVCGILQKRSEESALLVSDMLQILSEDCVFVSSLLSHQALAAYVLGPLELNDETAIGKDEIFAYVLLTAQTEPCQHEARVLKDQLCEVSPALLGIRLGTNGELLVELFDQEESSASFTSAALRRRLLEFSEEKRKRDLKKIQKEKEKRPHERSGEQPLSGLKLPQKSEKKEKQQANSEKRLGLQLSGRLPSRETPSPQSERLSGDTGLSLRHASRLEKKKETPAADRMPRMRPPKETRVPKRHEPNPGVPSMLLQNLAILQQKDQRREQLRDKRQTEANVKIGRAPGSNTPKDIKVRDANQSVSTSRDTNQSVAITRDASRSVSVSETGDSKRSKDVLEVRTVRDARFGVTPRLARRWPEELLREEEIPLRGIASSRWIGDRTLPVRDELSYDVPPGFSVANKENAIPVSSSAVNLLELSSNSHGWSPSQRSGDLSPTGFASNGLPPQLVPNGLTSLPAGLSPPLKSPSPRPNGLSLSPRPHGLSPSPRPAAVSPHLNTLSSSLRLNNKPLTVHPQRMSLSPMPGDFTPSSRPTGPSPPLRQGPLSPSPPALSHPALRALVEGVNKIVLERSTTEPAETASPSRLEKGSLDTPFAMTSGLAPGGATSSKFRDRYGRNQSGLNPSETSTSRDRNLAMQWNRDAGMSREGDASFVQERELFQHRIPREKEGSLFQESEAYSFRDGDTYPFRDRETYSGRDKGPYSSIRDTCPVRDARIAHDSPDCLWNMTKMGNRLFSDTRSETPLVDSFAGRHEGSQPRDRDGAVVRGDRDGGLLHRDGDGDGGLVHEAREALHGDSNYARDRHPGTVLRDRAIATMLMKECEVPRENEWQPRRDMGGDGKSSSLGKNSSLSSLRYQSTTAAETVSPQPQTWYSHRVAPTPRDSMTPSLSSQALASLSPQGTSPTASLRTLGFATRHLGREFDSDELNVLDEMNKIWSSSFFND